MILRVIQFVEMNCNFDKMNKLQFLHLNFVIKACFSTDWVQLTTTGLKRISGTI